MKSTPKFVKQPKISQTCQFYDFYNQIKHFGTFFIVFDYSYP